MTDNQRPRVEMPEEAAMRIASEAQAKINELLCSTDPKVRVLAQKLQVILDERTKNN